MGVDYYNCKACGEIFADCSDYGTCGSCYAHWCHSCMRDVTVFMFNDEERCEFCWKDEPKHPKPDVLLDFAIKKLKTTYEELRQEFVAQAGPEYRHGRDIFYCTQCDEGECASTKCELVHENYDINVRGHACDVHRGYCCKAQEFDDFDESCKGCRLWMVRQLAILLLGIRQFRPEIGLTTVSKDVWCGEIFARLFLLAQ